MAKISVFLLGNSTSLERAFARAEASAAGFNAELKATGAASKKASAQGGLFGGLFGGKDVLKTTAAVTGGVLAWQGLTTAIGKSIEAGQEAAAVQRQLAQQLATSGIQWSNVKGQIEESSLALSNLSGFSVDELERGLITATRATGDLNEALRINEIAANVARGSGKNLTVIEVALAKAYLGNETALKRLGIPINANLHGMALLEDVNKRFIGQAQAAKTPIDQMANSMHNLAVEVGLFATPAITGFADAVSFAANNWAYLLSKLRTPNLSRFNQAYNPLARFMGGGGGAAAVAPPSRRLDFSSLSGGLDDFRRAFLAAMKKRESLMIPQRNAWFDSAIGRSLDRVQDITSIRGQIGRLQEIAGLVQKRLDATKDVTRRLTLEDRLATIQRQVSGDRQQLADTAAQSALDQSAKAQAAADAAKTEALAWADFAIERAGATKSLQDDLKAQQAKLGLLEKQAGVGKKTEAQAQAIWETQKAITDLQKQIAGEIGKQSAFHRRSAAQIAAAVPGLNAGQRRALQESIAGYGTGYSHARSGQFATGVVINGGVHLHGVQDVKGLEDELARRAKTRPQVRRGAR